MQLLTTETQPLHRKCERGRGYALQAKELLVERRRLVQICGVDAHVVDRDCGHAGNVAGRSS